MTRIGFFSLLTLYVIETLAVIASFQIFTPIDCRLTGLETECRALRSVFISALCVVVALVLVIYGQKNVWRRFFEILQNSDRENKWALIHLVGISIIFFPLLIIPNYKLNQDFIYVFWRSQAVDYWRPLVGCSGFCRHKNGGCG